MHFVTIHDTQHFKHLHQKDFVITLLSYQRIALGAMSSITLSKPVERPTNRE
jgi:hypothetical protein